LDFTFDFNLLADRAKASKLSGPFTFLVVLEHPRSHRLQPLQRGLHTGIMINWPCVRPFEGAGIVAGDVQKAKDAILAFDASVLTARIIILRLKRKDYIRDFSSSATYLQTRKRKI